jgi:hypothetical protein
MRDELAHVPEHKVRTSWLRRIGPALLLVFLAPIIAEFLLGDFTIKKLGMVIILLPMYGCGALLIREIVRRAGRGWPSMLLLAVAYAFIEEAFLTQSLFNPNYVGQRLLDYGYIPALGTSLNWSLFVISIHVVWSVATPILIAEGIAAERRTEPWLKSLGLAIASLLFVLGCAAVANFSRHESSFVATRNQFLVAGVLVLLVIGGAFAIKPAAAVTAGDGSHQRVLSTLDRTAPQPWLVFLFAFAVASLFLIAESFTRSYGMWPALSLLIPLACEFVAILLIVRWSHMRGWKPSHYLALAAGASLTYALFGLSAIVRGHTNLREPTDRVDIAGQIIEALAILLLLAWAIKRNRRAALHGAA